MLNVGAYAARSVSPSKIPSPTPSTVIAHVAGSAPALDRERSASMTGLPARLGTRTDKLGSTR